MNFGFGILDFGLCGDEVLGFRCEVTVTQPTQNPQSEIRNPKFQFRNSTND